MRKINWERDLVFRANSACPSPQWPHPIVEEIFNTNDMFPSVLLQVIERIGSLTLVESLDQGGFSLKGMPEVKVISEVSICCQGYLDLSTQSTDKSLIIHYILSLQSHPGDDEAYGHIARLAVFLEQSRMDEDTHEPSSVSYVPHLREIEEDIYWILCSLQGAMHQQKQQVSQHVTHDVMAVELRDIPDRMMRRQRDYIILRDSAQVLYHTSNHFSRQATDLSAQSSTWLNRLR